MNISKAFVTESGSHAKKLSPKVLKLKDFVNTKSFFFFLFLKEKKKKKKKKKDYDLDNILSPSSLQRSSIKLLFTSKAFMLCY